MAIRARLKRLQKALRGNLEAIPQRDGSTVYIDLEEAFVDMFKYFSDSLVADAAREERPAPPPVLVAVANAADRRAAYAKVMGEHNHIPLDPEVLVEEGRFEPRCLVAGYATYQEYMASGGGPNLSE